MICWKNYSDCLLVFAVSGYQTDDKTEARTGYVGANRAVDPWSDANFPYYLHTFNVKRRRRSRKAA